MKSNEQPDTDKHFFFARAEDEELFDQILGHPQFKKDPFETINQYLKVCIDWFFFQKKNF